MESNIRSPLVKLALPQFKRTFSDLFSIRATILPFDRVLIEAIFEQIMWFGREKRDYNDFEKTARTSYFFLDQGSQTKYSAVAQEFLKVMEQIVPAYNRSLAAFNTARSLVKDNLDGQIKDYLDYYKTMYEGLLPTILAPIVYAFASAKHLDNKRLKPRADGKIDLGALDIVGRWLAYPENRLSIGLNNHVRNAYAHETYKILDGGKVELWDIDPHRPEKKWGPEIWVLDDLIKLCDKLWINALGIICGLILYKLNNWHIIESRGLFQPTQPPELRRGELEAALSNICSDLGFNLSCISIIPSKVAIELSTESKGIDQEAKLYLGYRYSVQVYKIPVKYVERKVVVQIVKFLYQLIPYFPKGTEVSIRVVTPKGEVLGDIVIDLETFARLNIKDTEEHTVEEIRHTFKLDTIGDSTTYIRIEETPRKA
jgi:hypothetical protein